MSKTIYIPDWLEQSIDDALIEKRALPLKSRLRALVHRRYLEEMSRPPRIALIGKAGVGKSSTINALFNTHLRVGHTQTGTYAPKKITVNKNGQLVKGGNGEITVYDMPGLGEDTERNEQFIDELI